MNHISFISLNICYGLLVLSYVVDLYLLLFLLLKIIIFIFISSFLTRIPATADGIS